MFSGSLYDLVGFPWSTLFTVGWNGAVCIAALSSLLGICRINNLSEYEVIEGDNSEYTTLETDNLEREREGDS